MHYFKKKLQFIFKFFVSKIFIIFYGKVKISKVLPNGVKIKKVLIGKNSYKIFNIHNGVLYTDYVQNVAIIKDNIIIDDISYQQINGELKSTAFNIVLKRGTPAIKKKINIVFFL